MDYVRFYVFRAAANLVVRKWDIHRTRPFCAALICFKSVARTLDISSRKSRVINDNLFEILNDQRKFDEIVPNLGIMYACFNGI